MPLNSGGLGLSWLSDQILMGKWVMIWWVLHSDLSTCIATEGLLHKALRLGHTDTGVRSVIVQSNMPQLLTGLIELSRCKVSPSARGVPLLKIPI